MLLKKELVRLRQNMINMSQDFSQTLRHLEIKERESKETIDSTLIALQESKERYELVREENDALRAKLSKLEPTQTLTELNLSLAVSMSDEEGSSVVLSPR